MAMRLALELQGPQGQFILERSPGLFSQRWELQDPLGRVFCRFRLRFLRWELRDCSNQLLAWASFSNPTILGQDDGVLWDPYGLSLANMRLYALGWLSSRWRAELELLANPHQWEPFAIALATLRLANKQQR